MPRRWEPSIADQLEEVAATLVEVSYAVTAIAEQLREKPTKRGKDGARLSDDEPQDSAGEPLDDVRPASLKRSSGRARRRSVLGSKART